MKELFTPFRNWRVIVLAVLVMFAAVFILGDCDDMGYLLFTKGVGFGLAYIIYRLGKYWDAKGKINELTALAEEE
ncbi:MAG: hypothetical protein [Bacteriophage sp.]|nr:MAG: hypothetical protein [Bacteriophage sp.]